MVRAAEDRVVLVAVRAAEDRVGRAVGRAVGQVDVGPVARVDRVVDLVDPAGVSS